MTHQDIFRKALSMPSAERAGPAQALLNSLDDTEPGMSEHAVERAWGELAERRLCAVESGAASTIPANQVMRTLHERIGQSVWDNPTESRPG